ncbi:MAG: hypothetical protein WCJ30_08730 [Deltaproteobacteria bacterium]
MRRLLDAQVLAEEVTYPYLDSAAKIALDEAREDLGALLRRAVRPIQVEAGVARWWTFAGGRINYTLKYALEHLGGWKVVADNFMLRIEGASVAPEAVAAAIGRLGDAGWWSDERNRRDVLARLPEYRLSKFQRAMPDWAATEMIGAYLLDVDGTVGWLGR